MLLPPAFRRNGEGNVFSRVYLSVHTRGVPHLANVGYPHPVLMGGYPHPVPVGNGVPPSSPSRGYPTPHQLDEATPPPGLDGGTPPCQDWVEYTPSPHPDSSRASTCYTAGGMPLAFNAGILSCFLMVRSH